ncbi:hypothetical protein BDF14DRAFT_1730893 [Spinellus fusiger]|nr:hypothetical protein BDF14DRAFT_1730893 [Spinellus fusiger]
MIDTLSHEVKMSKLLSHVHYGTTYKTEPYWLKADRSSHTLTLLTNLSLKEWSYLRQLAKHWQVNIQQEYASERDVFRYVDVHLLVVKSESIGILSHNSERNIARLYARTDYVCDMPVGILPSSHLLSNWKKSHTNYIHLLAQGDVLVLPHFKLLPHHSMPTTKSQLLQYHKEINDSSSTLPLNSNPTNIDHWIETTSLYKVDHYEHHYNPIAIHSKTVVPWCPERFLDKRSACFFTSYMSGSEFYVLPIDYAVQLFARDTLRPIDHVIELRLYTKYYWEQCVYQTRQLNTLGLWAGPQSLHVRQQCSRVIFYWGKRFIQK